MTVVAVYTPPEDHELRVKEQFYHKLDLVVGRCPAGDVLLFFGNFNAKTGNDRAGYESFLGPHGFGARKKNNQLLLNPSSRYRFHAG